MVVVANTTDFGVYAETSGLGKEAVLVLSRKQPTGIYFTGRSSKGAAEVIPLAKDANPNVNVVFLECDQTSLPSVEIAIKHFLSKS